MAKTNRDDFLQTTKLQLAKRAGWLCSEPSCRKFTVGSTSDGKSEINVGTAAHICAASPGGPRYDPNMTREQRRSADNGIWMCRNHGKAVDAKDSKFTVQLLHDWKDQAQKESFRRAFSGDSPNRLPAPQPTEGDLNADLRAAAASDLEVFRRSDRWPPSAITLTLEVDGLKETTSPSALPAVLTNLDDLVLVAPPGVGKTTTVFQIAEAALANDGATPIIVPLGDWSTDRTSLLDFVQKRPAFRQISEDDIRAVASNPGVALLLDGWNELDSSARRRAAFQIDRLRIELPDLSLLISTRKQALDVPIDGTHISILPLDENQQLGIARALRGEAGERLVDEAWRTPGVGELVTIPLYLRALLSLPEGAPFPTTKEEVLRRFVAAHEKDTLRAEALASEMHGCHPRFLEGLAVAAMSAANTTLAESTARRSVSETDEALVSEGQITEKPQPKAVLDTLVNHHVLMRAGDPAGYSFQHHQFQEWYASHSVERLMLNSVEDESSRQALRASVLNLPVWEEPILFACERLALGSELEQEACAEAILTAYQVDPMLAAEMICRSTEAVWARIRATIQDIIGRWHTPGRVDRALRFMISSGRPEFLDQIWPLITHENSQVNLTALRAGSRFRTTLLGPDAAVRIAALPRGIRENVLHEIAMNAGMDGLDLAASIAKSDPDADVRTTVIDAFTFRRADRHIADVLHTADDKTFDLLVNKQLVAEIPDETIKARLLAARARVKSRGIRPYDQMHSLVFGPGDDDPCDELVTLIAETEFDKNCEGGIPLIYEAAKRFPSSVADGILRRVREGRTLPHHAPELMSGSRFSFEDDSLVEIALEVERFDARADAAVSILGPQSVNRIIDEMFTAEKLTFDSSGRHDRNAADRYHAVRNLVGHAQHSSLLGAVSARSPKASNHEIANLAGLLSRHSQEQSDRGESIDASAAAEIARLVDDWANRLLDSPEATRSQLASIATLGGQFPAEGLVPLLKRLLDEDLRRWRAFRDQAQTDGYRGGEATNEARTSWTLQYQRAFDAIGGPETAALMRTYLLDERFGPSAAIVLAQQWRAENDPATETRWISGPDFSFVSDKRVARRSDPDSSATQADVIFAAVEHLIGVGATETGKSHAVSLAIQAAALPHGRRCDILETLLDGAGRKSGARLLLSLVLSGEIIDFERVKQGISDVLEAAETEAWILTNGYELREWLQLLPFTDCPAAALGVVQALPAPTCTADTLKALIDACGVAPGGDAEKLLFDLAEAFPSLYTHDSWQRAVIRRGSLSSAVRFVDLAAQGLLLSSRGGGDQRHLSVLVGELIGNHPTLRAHVYDLLHDGESSPGLLLLAKSVAENPDTDGLILLIQFEIKDNRGLVSRQTIERVVTQWIPAENWRGAYNVIPVSTIELRRKLLSMTRGGGPTDVPARCLRIIDDIRDDHGTLQSEPRHPDLDSGKEWPITTAEPESNQED